jgi:hypothetical protein
MRTIKDYVNLESYGSIYQLPSRMIALETPSYSRKRGHCAITLQSKLPIANNTVD